jgi:uncharacterized protein YacL
MKKLMWNIWGGWFLMMGIIIVYFVLGKHLIINYSVISFNVLTIIMSIIMGFFFFSLPPDNHVIESNKDDKFKAGVFEGDDA